MNLNQLNKQRELYMWNSNIYTKYIALRAIRMTSLYSLFLILLTTEYYAYGNFQSKCLKGFSHNLF